MRSIFLFLCIVLPASALTIGISPGNMDFNSMVRDGYAEGRFTVSTASEEQISGSFQVEGDIAGWVEFSPSDSFRITSSSPHRVTFVLRPPADTPNGNYTGMIRAVTGQDLDLQEGAGSGIIAAVASRIRVEITGEETISCSAGAFKVYDAEEDSPLTVECVVRNDGNVRLSPLVILKEGEEVLLEERGDDILPTQEKKLTLQSSHDLSIGQHFATILLPECGSEQQLSFDVVEKGGIADKGDFVGIRTEPSVPVDEPMLVLAAFRNIGERPVTARFSGEVNKQGKVVSSLWSDEVIVSPGESYDFRMYHVPEKAGIYHITGRINYNKKVTPDARSKDFEVIKASRFPVLMLLAYAGIGLTILILISKIRRGLRRKRHSLRP